jgi:hypothetical protein
VDSATVQMEMEGMKRSEDFAEENLFAERWASRHNAELWGTGPSGMYDSAAAFAPSKAQR